MDLYVQNDDKAVLCRFDWFVVQNVICIYIENKSIRFVVNQISYYAFIELVGLDKSRLSNETIEEVTANLELSPE